MMTSPQEIIAIIDTLSPTSPASVDYYLWITTWPDTAAVRAAYRASPRGRALYSRVIADGYIRRNTAPWTPLLILNAIPVFEELFLLIGTKPHPADDLRIFMIGFWEHCAALARPSRILHDPTIRDPLREWVTTVAIPWIATNKNTTIIVGVWNNIILPTWEAVRFVPHPTIPDSVASELTNATWTPERVVEWCLPYDDAAELKHRWNMQT